MEESAFHEVRTKGSKRRLKMDGKIYCTVVVLVWGVGRVVKWFVQPLKSGRPLTKFSVPIPAGHTCQDYTRHHEHEDPR